jgi:hypothetical protein
MTSSKLMALALCALAALAGAAAAEKLVLRARPAPQNQRAEAPVSDPAEPPMTVEVSFGAAGAGGPGGPRAARAVGARGGVGSAAVAVASSARGTTLTLNTPGSWQGTANLTFKNAAPPMRFTLRLARMPSHDLSSLSIRSGSLTLPVGPVGTTATTKYFDAKGRAQQGAEGAAYTLTARRRDSGEVELRLRRGPGAALGKALSVSWSADAMLEQEILLRAAMQVRRRGG